MTTDSKTGRTAPAPDRASASLVAVSVELGLTATALVDLARRPRDLVRGPKTLWALGCLVQPVGPIAYLTIGARRS